MTHQTISVPIRSYFLKFIAKFHKISPFEITKEKQPINVVFFDAFSRQKKGEKETVFHSKFNDQIQVRLSADFYAQKTPISKDFLNFVDSGIRVIFEKELHLYLDKNCFGKGDIQKYCLEFMDDYNISEDEISLDALLKSYQRYRHKSKSKQNINFRRKAK